MRERVFWLFAVFVLSAGVYQTGYKRGADYGARPLLVTAGPERDVLQVIGLNEQFTSAWKAMVTNDGYIYAKCLTAEELKRVNSVGYPVHHTEPLAWISASGLLLVRCVEK